MKSSHVVVAGSGIDVYEGTRAQCNRYIKQALQKGSQPGYLKILSINEFEHPKGVRYSKQNPSISADKPEQKHIAGAVQTIGSD